MKTFNDMNLIFSSQRQGRNFREKINKHTIAKLKSPKQRNDGVWYIPEGFNFGKTLSLPK